MEYHEASFLGVSGSGRLRLRQTMVSLALFVLIWELAARFTPDYMIPTLAATAQSLVSLRVDWVGLTILRVFIALCLSFLSGFLVAVLMYFWSSLEGYLMVLVKILMAVPVVCWVLFAVLWFPGVEFRIGFVLVAVCAPIFLVDLLDGMKSIPRDLREMVWSFRPRRSQFFRALILPAVLPSVLTGWKVNLGLAIRVVTIAELVGATSGIGYGLVVAQGLFSISDIFAWTLVLVLILLISQQFVGWLEQRWLGWREAG